MATYDVTFIDVAGEEVKRETVEYDVKQHESYGFIRRDAAIRLVTDAPEFGGHPTGALSQHIGPGYVEPVVIDERRLLICHESFMHKLEDREWQVNPHPRVVEWAKVYGERAALAYGREDWRTYPFAGPIVLIEERP